MYLRQTLRSKGVTPSLILNILRKNSSIFTIKIFSDPPNVNLDQLLKVPATEVSDDQKCLVSELYSYLLPF